MYCTFAVDWAPSCTSHSAAPKAQTCPWVHCSQYQQLGAAAARVNCFYFWQLSDGIQASSSFLCTRMMSCRRSGRFAFLSSVAVGAAPTLGSLRRTRSDAPPLRVSRFRHVRPLPRNWPLHAPSAGRTMRPPGAPLPAYMHAFAHASSANVLCFHGCLYSRVDTSCDPCDPGRRHCPHWTALV